MSFDSHKNFSYSTVATAPSPASSGTTLLVSAGDGSKFPTVPFNATVWPANSQPTTANAEIVRVTAISTDTFTITRTQESTSARGISVGDQIAATITAKTLTDIESAIAPTRQIFTSSGTYTLPSGCKAILVECIGAGGGGGGTPATSGSGNGQTAAGGGGGGGGYAASLIASPSASYPVTVGSGGAGSSGAGGSSGGDTSFGSVVIAKGGGGAPVAVKDVGVFPDTSGSSGSGGGSSVASTGDLVINGGPGAGGNLWSLTMPGAGGGGGSPRGATTRQGAGIAVTAAGHVGTLYGGGGNGASALTSAAAQAGGTGAGGICIVTEYY